MPRSNGPERAFEQLARSKGWRPSKRGWPDFICFGPDNEVIAVEVKPRTKKGRLQHLKRDQVEVMAWLQSAGVKVYVSDGHTLEHFDAEAQRSIHRQRDERRRKKQATLSRTVSRRAKLQTRKGESPETVVCSCT